MKTGHVAVLRRFLPIGEADTVVKDISDSETVASLAHWAEKRCIGQTVMVSLEIVRKASCVEVAEPTV